MDIEKLVPNPYYPSMNLSNLHVVHRAFNEARQLTFNAVVKWLKEPCDEHPWKEVIPPECKDHKPIYSQHRFECPTCMQSLQEASKRPLA